MAMSFERKRDAAFKLLAELGFEWDGKTWAPTGEVQGGWLSPEGHQSMLVVGDAMYDYVVTNIRYHGDPDGLAAYRQARIKAAEEAAKTDPILMAARADPALQAAEAEREKAFREMGGGTKEDCIPDDVAAIELWMAGAWEMTTGVFERHHTETTQGSRQSISNTAHGDVTSRH